MPWQVCTKCRAAPNKIGRWKTSQFEGCSSIADTYTCAWGGVCAYSHVQNRCLDHVFGFGIEPHIKFEGCTAANQQWILRHGVVRGHAYE